MDCNIIITDGLTSPLDVFIHEIIKLAHFNVLPVVVFAGVGMELTDPSVIRADDQRCYVCVCVCWCVKVCGGVWWGVAYHYIS